MTNVNTEEGNMLDPKEEKRYDELRRLAQELHLPIPEAFLTLEVFDKDGKLIQRHRQRSHSWTRNAYNCIFSQIAGKNGDDITFEAGKLSPKDTAGALKDGDYPMGGASGSVDGTDNGYRAPSGDDTKGILVGRGENAESFEDFFLQTQNEEGTGANELNHVESQPHSVSYADTTLTSTLVRYFNNNTVGETNVDVNEVALVGMFFVSVSAVGMGKLLMSRDKLAGTVTVPSTGQLKVTYTVSLTYPS